MLQHENENIEYKEKLTDSFEKETVAFLNAKGGCIYIGVKDNGKIVGIQNVDKLQLQIKDRLIFAIAPSILSLISIGIENIDNKNVIKISVKEGNEKPYYIKKQGLSESGAFIRIGSSAQPMTSKMIFSFQNKSFPKSLLNIESPEQELTFAELFIHYHRYAKPLNDNTFARTLNFFTKDGKYNYLAYLMADNNQVSVRFARFNDEGERFELIEKAVEYGNCCLITAIQRVLDRFEIENITRSRLTGAARRIDKRLVDAKCLREIIINAFAHNDYSYGMLPIFEVFQNRFAVRSYGGLVPQLTINDFFLGVSALRNPELMRILKDVELVEALGFGIRGITKVYARDIFEFTDNTIYVTLPFENEVLEKSKVGNEESKVESKVENEESKVKSRVEIIELIKENPKITAKEMSEKLELSLKTIEKHLKTLRDTSKIKHIGAKKSGEWIVESKESEVENKKSRVENKKSRVENKKSRVENKKVG